MDSTDESAWKLPSSAEPSASERKPSTPRNNENEYDLKTSQDESIPMIAKALPVTTKDPFRLKCVVVGDPLVGKTSMIQAYANNKSPFDDRRNLLTPGLSEVQELKVIFEGKLYTLVIQDTDYNHENRINAYEDADIIIMCYSVNDVTSLKNIDRKWIPELKQHAQDKPYILVGCKLDIRTVAARELALEIVDEYEGMHLSAAIDSQSFFECSAKTLENIKRFNEEIPVSVERFRLLSEKKLAARSPQPQSVTTNAYAVATRPVSIVSGLLPILRQSYYNISQCMSNPGAFIERKKSIVYYVPMLKSWLPYEEEAVELKTAREEPPKTHPSLKQTIQKRELKRLFNDEKKESDKEKDTQGGSKRQKRDSTSKKSDKAQL